VAYVVKFNRDYRLGAIDLYFVGDPGAGASMDVGIGTAAPSGSTDNPNVSAYTTNAIAAGGTSYKRLTLGSAVVLLANTEYWIYVKAPNTTIGNTIGSHFSNGNIAPTSPMVAPASQTTYWRGAGTWASAATVPIFIQPYEEDIPSWVALAPASNLGVPAGGAAGQVPLKISAADGDISWGGLPSTSISDSSPVGRSVITGATTRIVRDAINAQTKLPSASTKGDLLVGSGTTSAAYTSGTSATVINATPSTTEKVVSGAVVELAAVGSSVSVVVDLHASMNNSGLSKSLIWRVRRDDINGAIVGNSGTKSATTDSAAGNDSGFAWSTTLTDATPTTGRYVVTVQANNASLVDIWSNQQNISASTTAVSFARQAIGTDGQVLTADAAQSNGLKWATPDVVWKTIVTPATDVRPVGNHVLWVGGTTRPTNMITGDIWFKSDGTTFEL
jgi:hypothetical protein